MRKIYLYLVTLFFTGFLSAQQYGYHYFTDSYQDQFNISLKTSDSCVLNFGKGQPGSNNYFSVMKTSATNEILWYKLYENPGILLVLGATESNDHKYYVTCNIENGGMLLLGIDSDGNEIANTAFNFPNEGEYVSNFFIAPAVQGNSGFIMGGAYDDTLYARVNFLASCDPVGNVLWSKYYTFSAGTITPIQLFNFLPDTGGYFGMAEFYQNSTHYVGALKVDENGNVLWTKTYGSFTEATGNGVLISRLKRLDDGTYLFLHYAELTDAIASEIYSLNGDGSLNNVFQWNNPSTASVYLTDIVPSTGSSYVAAGMWQDTGRSPYRSYYFLAKGTRDGDIGWAEIMISDTNSAETPDQLFSLVQMNADEYRAYGNSGYSLDIIADFNSGGQGLCKPIPETTLTTQQLSPTVSSSNVLTANNLTVNTSVAVFAQSSITVAYDSACSSAITTDIPIEKLPVNGISVFPNPATNSITITDQSAEKIEFFDLLGRNITTIQVTSAETEVNVSKFPNVFFIRTMSGAVSKVERQ